MTITKKCLSRTLAVVLVSCMALFGLVAVTNIVYADGDEPQIQFYKSGGVGPITEDTIWTDEVDVEYSIDYEGEQDLQVEVYGEEYDEEQEDWVPIELSDNAWSYNHDGRIVRIDGQQCWEELKDRSDQNVEIHVYYDEDDDGVPDDENLENWLPIELREAFIEYDFEDPENDFYGDWVMYKDEEAFIDKEGFAYMENSGCPNGKELEYNRLDVVSDQPEVVRVSEDDDDQGWDVKAAGYGDAVLTVTYRPVYSDLEETFEINVNVVEGYHEVAIEKEGVLDDVAFPGTEINFEAEGQYQSNVATWEGTYAYEWSLEDEDNIAELTSVGSKAKLTIDDIEMTAEEEKEIAVKVVLKDADNDEELADNSYYLVIRKEIDQLFVSDIDTDAFVGGSQKVLAEYRHFDKAHPNGYAVEGVAVDCEVGPANAATVTRLSNDPQGNFLITRNISDKFILTITAKNRNEEVLDVVEWQFNEAPSPSLDDYYLIVYDPDDYEVDGVLYLEEGQVFIPSIIVGDDRLIIDENKYDLKIEIETFDKNGDPQYTVVPRSEGVKAGEDGTATYRLTATAKAGSGFTGSLIEYLDVASNKSFNGFNAQIYFEGLPDEPNGVGERPMREYYALTVEDAAKLEAPDVYLGGEDPLERNKDYTLYYVTENDEDDPDATRHDNLPTNPGTYVCMIKGIEPYYGTSATIAFQVVNTETELDAIAIAREFQNRIQEFFDAENLQEKKDFVEERKQELKQFEDFQPEVFAAIPDRVKDMVESIDKYVEFLEALENVDPANPNPAAVQKAREAYNAIPGYFKDLVEPTDMNRLTAAEKKIADDKAAAAAEARAMSVKTVTINVKTVNAAAVNSAVAGAGGSSKYVTKFVLGKSVKSIKKGAFDSYKGVTTLEVKTKKLKKGTVKNSLKGSNVKTIKVNVGKKKANKKQVKKYKKIFTKKVVGKKVKVR